MRYLHQLWDKKEKGDIEQAKEKVRAAMKECKKRTNPYSYHHHLRSLIPAVLFEETHFSTRIP